MNRTFYGIIAIVLILLGCNVPKDPEKSWEYAIENELLVGVAYNSPFVELKDGKNMGTEVNMVSQFAAANGIHVQWVQGSESQLIEKMKAYKLHLIIGGFEKNTLWTEQVGITRPYDKQHVWLVARGENKLVGEVEKYFLQNKKQE